ncbi:MAG: aminotransferase class III-fold pyridoxal phosphate-dependent enzyme [Planctomyces sp.]|jgi:acetylornithine/succinyldiaminopimelate/putrescine aminotransferase
MFERTPENSPSEPIDSGLPHRISSEDTLLAADLSAPERSVLETCDRIARLKIPNLLRLYLNPFVAQTCVALSEIVQTAWPSCRRDGSRPSFLANSGEEALSGAIKLARFTMNTRSDSRGRTAGTPVSADVLLIDEEKQFPAFEAIDVKPSENSSVSRVEWIPGIRRVSAAELQSSDILPAGSHVGIVVFASLSATDNVDRLRAVLQRFQASGGLLVFCLNSDWEHHPLAEISDSPVRRTIGVAGNSSELRPDIVVFDSSFTDNAVPFGAFNSDGELYSQWMKKGMATFHSTTYQPNTISTMHFLKCLEKHAPRFFSTLENQLKPLLADQRRLKRTFQELYSPSLGRIVSASGFDDEDITASGHFVRVGSRRMFDGIGGVACSIRGHNPEHWSEEIRSLGPSEQVQTGLANMLFQMTGLRHFVPAVSGGSSVEQALELALVAQAPRRTVIALQGGFGGKTLVALTGTSRDSYKSRLDPLYQHVVYIDPFAPDALETLRSRAALGDVAVIQLELIQGVGGVRKIPPALTDALQSLCDEHGILLFVDEIQTGMFRTGPFIRSNEIGLSPDLLTVGKGTSDMMFPFALTLFSDRVERLLHRSGTDLPLLFRQRNNYEIGYRCVLNTLKRSYSEGLSEQVRAAGAGFEDAFRRHLSPIRVVRETRVFGLLIGIELNLDRTLLQKMRLNATHLFLAQMMRHPGFPLLMGFCQYEPSILKFTPPLSVTPDETEAACQAIGESLQSSTMTLLRTGFGALRRARK